MCTTQNYVMFDRPRGFTCVFGMKLYTLKENRKKNRNKIKQCLRLKFKKTLKIKHSSITSNGLFQEKHVEAPLTKTSIFFLKIGFPGQNSIRKKKVS